MSAHSRRLLLWGGIGLGVIACLAITFAFLNASPVPRSKGDGLFSIEKGWSLSRISRELQAQGFIRFAPLLDAAGRLGGTQGAFKAGFYRIPSRASTLAIHRLLVEGAQTIGRITLPEGWTAGKVASHMEAEGVCTATDFMAATTSPDLLAKFDIQGPSLEGYLYPDTYKMRVRTPATRALVPLVRRHRQVYEELRTLHAKGLAELRRTLGWDDHKVVILASIVEKETGQAQERPRIAQVFLNRLRFPTFKPKLLQTDPTIIYGCTVAVPRSAACSRWDGRIRRIQLDDKDNLYSTYAHEGLPPGPISNPGRAALEAVMAPDKTPYLYFVSRNDGTHVFARTVAEHEANVTKFQRGGKPMGEP
jgi:uncharacterized YceG family protein